MSHMSISKVLLYARTIRRMRPGMVAARLRKTRHVSENAKKAAPTWDFVRLSIEELDCDPRIAKRFDIDALNKGEFSIINERHTVDLGVWNVPAASHLWNFNLHYFEYCIPLAARYARERNAADCETFKRLASSWIVGNPYAEGDAWHPYTISLRLINWLICIDLFKDAFAEDHEFVDHLRASMYLQYRHLLINQELHLRANHYFENVKTILICSMLFGEEEVYRRTLRVFESQLNEQILPDGVHFERSLMYHKLMLEGLLRVWIAAKQTDHELPIGFIEKAKLMLDAMASLEKGMGKTPFFNDAADGVAKDCDQLERACESILGMTADDAKTDFPAAGYYKLYDGDIAVMFDAGEPGPSYMLGHAHCDALSYELSYQGKPVVVNSGTYAYQSELRPYFRSTAAHNTAIVNGEEQLECWGEHRVSRGYKIDSVHREGNELEAVIKLPSGMLNKRIIRLAGGVFSVHDESGVSSAWIESHVHHLQSERHGIEIHDCNSIEQTESIYSPALGIKQSLNDLVFRGVGLISYDLAIKESDGK